MTCLTFYCHLITHNSVPVFLPLLIEIELKLFFVYLIRTLVSLAIMGYLLNLEMFCTVLHTQKSFPWHRREKIVN